MGDIRSARLGDAQPMTPTMVTDALDAATEAFSRLQKIAWAEPEQRAALTILLLHTDVPTLITNIHTLCDAVEEMTDDRPTS